MPDLFDNLHPAAAEPREAAEVLLVVGLSTVSDLTAPWPGTIQAVDGAEADYQAFYHSLASAIAQLSIQRTRSPSPDDLDETKR